MDTKKLEKAKALMQQAMDLVESCYSDGADAGSAVDTNPDSDSRDDGDDDGAMNSLRMKLGKYKG